MIALHALGVAAPAQAQIYSWRDANGNLVLSNRRPATRPRSCASYAVPKAEGLRATRSVAAERARAYDDLIAEHAPQQRRPRRPRARRDAGGVGVQPVRAIAEGRDGADAADAGDGAGSSASGTRSTRPRTCAPASPTCASCSTATRTTKSSRSRPTTPAPAPSTSTARACRPTAKRRTTSRRSTRWPADGRSRRASTPIYKVTDVDRRPRGRPATPTRSPPAGAYESSASRLDRLDYSAVPPPSHRAARTPGRAPRSPAALPAPTIAVQTSAAGTSAAGPMKRCKREPDDAAGDRAGQHADDQQQPRAAEHDQPLPHRVEAARPLIAERHPRRKHQRDARCESSAARRRAPAPESRPPRRRPAAGRGSRASGSSPDSNIADRQHRPGDRR